MIRRPPRSTLCPYATLYRAGVAASTLTFTGGTFTLGGNVSGPAAVFSGGTVNFTGAGTTAGPFTSNGGDPNFNHASAGAVKTDAVVSPTRAGPGGGAAEDPA